MVESSKLEDERIRRRFWGLRCGYVLDAQYIAELMKSRLHTIQTRGHGSGDYRTCSLVTRSALFDTIPGWRTEFVPGGAMRPYLRFSTSCKSKGGSPLLLKNRPRHHSPTYWGEGEKVSVTCSESLRGPRCKLLKVSDRRR